MNPFYMITTIAVYEAKTLMRGWFFRIFAIGSLLFFGFFDFFALASFQKMDWEFKAIAGNIPYSNLLFLNTVQAVIAIFLASDFLKRDRKDDTTEVVYMRSITNFGYVLGKTLGIMAVFLVINLAVLGLAAVFTLTISDIPFVWQAYLWDMLLISVPTIVFILGLSFLMMSLLRNQAVTSVVLLGYVITSMIFLGEKFHNLLDYIGYHIPFTYSGFGGFADLKFIVVHRGAYFLLGVLFILFSSLLLKRLPQSRISRFFVAAFAIISLSGGIYLGFSFLDGMEKETEFRTMMCDLANRYVDQPTITPLAYDIELEHGGEDISVKVACRFRNDNPQPLENFVMNLNPGLTVDSVQDASGNLTFTRELQVLSISLGNRLVHGAEDSLVISYHGTIDEKACYPDIEPDDRLALHRPLDMYSSKARFAWLSPEYVLLTPVSTWYPMAGAGYASSRAEQHQIDFCYFNLDVTTASDKTAVSQGKVTKTGEGKFTFTPEYQLPSLAVAIGNYELRSTTVDSIQYSIYSLEGHDYYSEFFTDVGDTMAVLIRDAKQDFENKVQLTYPFKRLTLLEVPIHFKTFRHMWSMSQETVLPELVLFPEKGAQFYSTDFKRTKRRYERQARETNQELSDMEIQSKMFRRFVRRILLGDYSPFRSHGDGELEFLACYNLFPNLFTYVNHLQSDDWPVLNLAMEAYFSRRLIDTDNFGMRFFEGMVPEERANMLLSEQSLEEILRKMQDRDYATLILEQKGEYLFKLMEKMFGKEEFAAFLEKQLIETRFTHLTLDLFLSGLQEEFGTDFRPLINSWYSTASLPGFEISNFTTYKVLDGDRERYQVRFWLENPENVPGLARVSFERQAEEHSHRDFDDSEDIIRRLVILQPGQISEQGFVLDYKPGSMAINTMVSRNLPLVFQQLCSDFELDRKAIPFDGERIVKQGQIQVDPGLEIIVDNEDPGFGFDKSPPASLIRRYIKEPEPEDKYVGFHFWKNMETWEPTINAHYFGKYVKSSHFTNSSGGKRMAWWEAEIPQSGFYDLYFFVSRGSAPWWYHENDTDRGEYQIRISTPDGFEETELDLNTAEDGWNFLGSYYLETGQSKVDLSNETSASYVLADAIKWVLR